MSVRSHETHRIVELLRQGTSVELVGIRWSGRSEILSQVRSTLADLDYIILNVVGTASHSPLEALRVALPPAYRRAVAEEGGTAAAISDALARYLSSGDSVVMIDDADLLDSASWSALIQLHRLLRRPIVASTLRRALTDPDEHLLIKAAHPVVQIALEGLRLDVLHSLLDERVDGSLAPSVSARIHMDSAGIPGLAVALLDGALAHGLIWRSGDQWVSGPALWSDDARGAYESVLYSYRPEIRDAVELLATTGTVEVTAAWALLGADLLEELEDNQLVRVTEVGADRRAMVAVHPPGLGDYFRNQPATARRRRILSHATDRLAHESSRLDTQTRALLLERLRPAGVPQRSASPTPAPLQLADVPAVSRMFTEAFDVQVGVARARWQEEGDPGAAVRYLGLLMTGPSDPREIEDVIGRCSELFYGTSRDHEAELTLRHFHSRWLLSRGADLSDVVRPLTEKIPTGFAYAEALDTLARAVRWELEGVTPDDERVLAARAAAGGLGADIAGVLLAACHLVSGRIADCITVLDGLDDELRPWLRVGVVLMRGLVLYTTGRVTELVDIAAAGAQRSISALDRIGFACHSYLGALGHLALGNLDEAQDALAILLTTGISAKTLYFSPDRAVLVLMAVISTRAGHESAASGYREHAAQIAGASDGMVLSDLRWTEAFSVAVSGATEVAAEIFAEVTRDARRRGYGLAADLAMLASLYIHYDPELAAQVADQPQRLGGPMYAIFLEARAAAHAQDPARVEAAARGLRGEGMATEALKYFNLAAHLYRDHGDNDRAAACREAARELADTNVRRTRRDRTAMLLTPREREIVQLIAADMSNGDIAAKLVLSVRTVENHIRNIRRKTGASTRGEIVALASTNKR